MKRTNKSLEGELQQYKEALEFRDNFIAVSIIKPFLKIQWVTIILFTGT